MTVRVSRFVLIATVLCGLGVVFTACAPGPGSAAFWGGFWEGYSGSTSTGIYSGSNSTGTVQSIITSDFDGFQYGNIYVLANGQVWEQTQVYYWYRYAYRPRVAIFSSYGSYKMQVEGSSLAVTVRRLR